MSGERMVGPHPAVVISYDNASRTCRVRIPAITDGGAVGALAQICYPIGDKSREGTHPTEIEIFPGDLVWVEFTMGDPRFPVITGHRCPNVGNQVGTRRFHHEKIHLAADSELKLTVGPSQIVKTPGGIVLRGPRLDLN